MGVEHALRATRRAARVAQRRRLPLVQPRVLAAAAGRDQLVVANDRVQRSGVPVADHHPLTDRAEPVEDRGEQPYHVVFDEHNRIVGVRHGEGELLGRRGAGSARAAPPRCTAPTGRARGAVGCSRPAFRPDRPGARQARRAPRSDGRLARPARRFPPAPDPPPSASRPRRRCRGTARAAARAGA